MAGSEAEKIVRDLLNQAGIQVNGPQPWDIQVHDPRLYERVLHQTSLGLGESYMDGWWDAGSIDGFITRVLTARLDRKLGIPWKLALQYLVARLTNRQSSSRAYTVGQRHYDLGNELYCAMLDKRLVYSCGYWKDAATLDEAQEAKLDLICRKLHLEAGMRILDIGCGWGGLVKYAAEKYGASAVGLTVSVEQMALGSELCKGLPVELRLQDYREVEGQFDAVVSVGSIEHFGYKNYRTYMEVVDRTLKPGGISLIHTIGGNQSVYTNEPWTEKYIFPNSMLPSIAQLGTAMEGLFVMEDWHNFGPYYDPTLMAWHANFENAWDSLKEKYDERFHRMWRYYLLSSAGGFRSRHQQLWQIVMTRTGTPQPEVRLG